MELVLQNLFEENTVWDFSYLKHWFHQQNYVYPMYSTWSKIHKPWLEKEDILCIIEADLGEMWLCYKNKFTARAPFFDHLRQKATYGSLIHYRLMQYLHILCPLEVKTPKQIKKVSPFMNIEFHETNLKIFGIQR